MSAMDLVNMNKQLSDNPLYVYNDNGDRFDISTQPVISDKLDIMKSVDSEYLNRDTKDFGTYAYNGLKVPRVTSVLKYCNNTSDYLMAWAAKLGDKYQEQSKDTLDIGTDVHAAIAEYLTQGTLYSIKNLRRNKDEVFNCLKNFLSWYKRVTEELHWSVNIFLSEAPLVCPWYGGTCDAIIDINGKRYVVDFKTSKKISTEYFIQASAYVWIIENYYPQYGHIDGIGILRFDKVHKSYEDIFLEFDIPGDYNFVKQCQQMFWLALNMFYGMNVLDNNATEIKKYKKKNSNTGKAKGSINQLRKKD